MPVTHLAGKNGRTLCGAVLAVRRKNCIVKKNPGCPACAGLCYADLPNELPRVIKCPGCPECTAKDQQIELLESAGRVMSNTINERLKQIASLQAKLETAERALAKACEIVEGTR